MQISRDQRLAIERTTLRAWPASDTADIEGWLWRSSGGGYQRTNSVSALAFHGTDPAAAIDEVERRYRARGAPPMFQVCDVNAPADLDAHLERRGYRLQEPCSVLAKTIAGQAAGMPDGVEIGERADAEWQSVYCAGISQSRRVLAPSILSRVPRPCAFLLVRAAGEPIATALGVVGEGVVIAECVATLTAHRRGGAAARVMRALEAWGAGQGATLAALGVVTANIPAQGLYARLDYARVGGYHYRLLDT